MPRGISWDKIKYFFTLGIFIAVYFLAAKAGLSLAFGVKQVTLFWPPTGIAIAALLLFGKKSWPGILIGAFLANITTHETVPIALGIAAGNTLEALAAHYLLDKFNFDKEFHHINDIIKFIIWGAFVPTLVSPTIGTTVLGFGGTIGWQAYGQTWLTWWMGDTVGAIIFAPLILSLRDIKIFPFRFGKLIEFLALFATTTIVSIFVFTESISKTFSMYPTKYLVFPFMIWAALGFGIPGATFISLLISVISIFGFIAGGGPFIGLPGGPEVGLTLLQLLMATFTVTSIILAAAIEERKRSEGRVRESEQRFKALIENSYEAIIVVDAAGIIKYASPSVKRILNYSPTELENTNGFNLIYKDDKAYLAKILAGLVINPGKVVQVQNRIVRKDGEMRWMEAVGTNLLQEDGVGGIVINFRDITEHKKIDETKSEFVSLAAHELRSPLSNIRWYTESLLKTYSKKDKVSEYIAETYSATLKMTSLVNMLLNVSKVELGTLSDNPETVDIVVLSKDITQHLKKDFENKDIKFTQKYSKTSIPAVIDPNLVRIIIENLLTNAIKYTADLGNVSLTVQEENKILYIKVEDNGVGIPESAKPKIFTKLFRADNVRKRFPDGTGLGLYLVKSVVDKLKGEIRFESTEGKGTKFFVSFPIKTK